MADHALTVDGLSVAYNTPRGWLKALDDVSLSIPHGTALGLVGESGSGKSSVVMALLGLLDADARITARGMDFDGEDLMARAPALRGRRVGAVFQDTSAVLNPAHTIGALVTEPLLVHRGFSRAEARARGLALLNEMGISRAEQVMGSYPHQLSGGMKQRVAIATALATEPDLLLLDEPTTALDVTIQAQILDLLDRLRAGRGLSMLLVSHNLGIIDRLCDRVSVLYAGRVAETGDTAHVLDRPRHPYTKGLLAALPRANSGQQLSPIPGGLPDLVSPDPGCNFRSRCAFAIADCARPQALQGTAHQTRCHRVAEIGERPWPSNAARDASTPTPRPRRPLVEAVALSRRFLTGGIWQRAFGSPERGVLAVDDVSITIYPGEVVGLVGESGCGKSTLGRLLLRLIAADSGALRFSDQEIGPRPDPKFHRRAQIVFQNPDTSLNPRQTIGTILHRPLRHFRIVPDTQRTQEIARLLDLVRLPASYAARYPHQLSGGEKQRVSIARALASRPDFLVCDEAVSALDVSVQAAVLNLLRDLRDALGLSYLFISHDIGVIGHIADRVAVMYRGSVLEEGSTHQVLRPPYHPYTELLISSVPAIGRYRHDIPVSLPTDRAETTAITAGCRFAARCTRRLGPICDVEPPPWQQVESGHRVRCHIQVAHLYRPALSS